jgi:hypothetical protein
MHHITIAALILSLTFCSAYAYDLQYHPFLLQAKDRRGITLAKHLDDVYGDKISVRDRHCFYFETQRNGDPDVEYELADCRIDYFQQTIYSKADRLNKIEIKGTLWIEGDAYRTRAVDGAWTEWKSSEFLPGVTWVNRTGFDFQKRDGLFIFKPTRGVENIHRSAHSVKKDAAKAVVNGEASGVVIQESGSGKIVYQESRQK